MFGNRSFTSPSTSTTSTSLFSSPQPNNVFGNSQTSNLFGNTTSNNSIFGANNNNSSFGTTANTFGANNNTFGANNNNSSFGTTANAFGTSNNSFGNNTMGNVFGNNPNQNNSVFGSSTTTGSVFGSSSNKGTNQYSDSTSTGLGKNPNSSNKNKVQCTFIKHHIYFMNQYEKKPITLLRHEDYQINKGNGGTTIGGIGNNNTAIGGGGGIFGSNTTTGNTGGLFGTANNNTANGGGGGIFGTNNNNNMNNTGIGGGLFGQNNNNTSIGTTGSIFGGGNTSNTAIGGGGLFGQTNNNTNTIGGGLFGSGNPAFGTNTTTTGGGLFGSNTMNNTNTIGGGGLFGQNNNTNKPGGLFGSSPTTTTGNTGGLFGTANNNTAFGGGSGGGLFSGNNNNNMNTGTGLFGGGNTSNTAIGGGGLFGQTNNNTSTIGGGLFGTSANNNNNPLGGGGGGGLFGTANNNTSFGGGIGGGLFGTGNTTSTTTGSGLFGQNNNNTTSLGGGLFGNNNTNKPGGLFGTTPTTTTTTTTTAGLGGGGGLFGTGNTNTTNTGGGLFGTNNNNSSIGGVGGGGGLFGNNNINKPGGLFGTSSSTTTTGNTGSLFGGGGGLFGSNNTSLGGGGSLFGTTNSNNNGLFGTNNNNNNNNNQYNPQLTEQIVDSCKKEPYTQGEFGLLKIGQQIDHCAQAAGVSNTATVENTSLTIKPKTISLPPLPSHSTILSKSLFSQNHTDCVIAPPSITNRCSKIKQLIITRSVNDDDEQKDSVYDEVVPVINSPHISPIKPDESDYYRTLSGTDLSKGEEEENDDDDGDDDDNENSNPSSESESENDSVKRSNPDSPIVQSKHHKSNNSNEFESDESSSTSSDSENEGDDEKEEEKEELVPKCSKEDYIIFPSISSLESKSKSQLASVKDFSICHKNIGSILWLGNTDVRKIDIDKTVIIDLDENKRPYVEVKSDIVPSLNKSAIITLFQIKRPADVDLQAFKDKLKKRATKMDATFLDYDDKSCQWRFQVEHFSRYGFMEEEDDDDEIDNKNKEENRTVTTTTNPIIKSNIIIPTIPHPNQQQVIINFNKNIPLKSISLMEEEGEENQSQMNQSSNILFSNRPILPNIEFNRLPMKQSPCFNLFQEVVGKDINNDSVHAFSVYCKDRSRPAYISFNNKIISIKLKNFSVVNCYAIPQIQSLVNYDEMKFILHSLMSITEIPNDSSIDSSSSDSEDEIYNNNNKPFRFGPISEVYDFLLEYSARQSCPQVVSEVFTLLLSLYLPRDSRNEIPNYIHEIQPNSTFHNSNGDDDEDDDDNNEKWQMLLYRKERITIWLIKIISNLHLPKTVNVYQNILYHLLHNDVISAANEAFENNDYNLSLLISQLNGDITTRTVDDVDKTTAMKLQLNCWKKYGIINKMNKDLLNIYYILSGDIQLLQLSSNVSKLPWICYVALYYWYGNESCGNLLSSLKSFDKYNKYLIHPNPLFYNNNKRTDILYHLLWYYADDNYDISHLLDNCSISTYSHDYIFTWILYYIIISMNNNNNSQSDLKNHVYINNSFIEQLEAVGLWEWAIYVGKFNENSETRDVVCREILERNIPEQNNRRYEEIIHFLNDNKIISPEEIENAERMRKY